MKLAALLFSALLPLVALGQAVLSTAGPYHLSISSDPPVVPVGSAKLLLKIQDSSGKPAQGLSLKVFAQMPSMPMGEREQPAAPVPGVPGTYVAAAVFGMAGGYDVRVTVAGPSGTFVSTSSIETGQDTSATSNAIPYGAVGGALLAFLLVLAFGFRMRKAGVRMNLAALRKPAALIPVLALLALVGAAVYAVNHFRRPGAMTPLEAQGMDMNTPAPPGSVAVTLATVKRKTIASTVRYVGQVVGYVEQDVYPRVTGTLTYMPLYVGDKVRKGQIVAKLDVSQLAPDVVGRESMAAAAAKGSASAQADDQAALAMVDQAKAEHEEYMDAIKEAEANLSSAKDNEAVMAAQTAAAESDLHSAIARRASAQADATYWEQELARKSKIFEEGGISRDEYQQAVNEQAKAQAGLDDMNSQIQSSEARLQAAQAAERQAGAATLAAQRKLAEAQHEMQIHQAHVATAIASETSAKYKAAQMVDEARQAQADLASARANESYATIRSQIDGVVTDRLATEGTLVQPGTSILKIAQINPIRIQANVPTADLAGIGVGASARLWTGESGAKAIEVRVTSVSPSVDPTARTGIVEAVVPNGDGKILPGQYDALDIETGRPTDALTVPSEAIQESSGGTSVWVAGPAGEGSFTVRQVRVKVGASDGTDTAILEGLSAGQQLVTSGFVNLEDGATVNAESPADSIRMAMSTPTVKIGNGTFEPAKITLAGASKHLSFLRTTDQTCAKEIVFPDLNIRKSLPLNEPVVFDLSSAKPGTYRFSCGMSMLRGQVVIP